MRFIVAPEVFARFPNYCVGLVFARNVKNGQNWGIQPIAGISDKLQSLSASVRESLTGKAIDELPAVAVWREAFAGLGLSSEAFPGSIEALIRRVVAGDSIPSVSPAVDLANTSSLRSSVPIGAHDLDRLSGDFVVREARERDRFTPRNETESEAVPVGEIVYADDLEVRTRRWVWRLGEKGKVRPGSQNILFPIDGFVGVTDLQARQAALELAQQLQSLLGAEVTIGFVDATHPTFDIPGFTPAPYDPVERLLTRRIVDVLPTREDFERRLRSGKKVRIYLGVDATSPTIHIGHSVPIAKLREFQDLGHKVILLIGDFTGRIGDPTDKSAMRVQLTPEQVRENATTYVEQAGKILDINSPSNPVEIRFNGEWWDKMTAKDIIEQAAYFTVQQMLQREMFQKRLGENRPIGLHEFLYPLLQGYDSVALDVDVELGGTDQTFNMLAGRTLVKGVLGKEKYVLTGPLLEGLDGRKMSKSYGNVIGVTDPPYEIYGKVMSLKDELITRYFEMVTQAPEAEIAVMARELQGGTNPMTLKKRLAADLVTRFHSEEEAKAAAERFEREIQRREVPEDLPEVALNGQAEWALTDLLVKCALASGKNDARRLIEGGSVELNGQKVTNPRANITIADGDVLRGRRRQYARLILG